MKAQVYELVWRIHRGFEDAVEGLDALRQHHGFHRRELERFAALTKEARAATGSYLAAIIEQAETEEAGRRYRKRRFQEQREERNSVR